jgi:hypothetical protein
MSDPRCAAFDRGEWVICSKKEIRAVSDGPMRCGGDIFRSDWDELPEDTGIYMHLSGGICFVYLLGTKQ